MHKTAWIIAGAIFAAGCEGVSESEFVVEYEQQYCARYPSCASPEMQQSVGERECLEWYRYADYPEPPECFFDPVAAEACLFALQNPTDLCDGFTPKLPLACEAVYGGCLPPQLPVEGLEEN